MSISKGLQAALAGDSGVTSLITEFLSDPSVFVGSAPKGAIKPYICIFDVSSIPSDTHASRYEDVVRQVSVYANSYYDAEEIFDAIDLVLHGKIIALDDDACLMITRVRGPVSDPDIIVSENVNYHRHADYKVLTQKL